MNVKELVQKSLDEDIFTGDISTDYLGLGDSKASAVFVAKKAGVIAGLTVAELAFKCVDNNTEFTPSVSDGDYVEKGTNIARIEGLSSPLLKAERVALNFIQRMSGIATLTYEFVSALKGTGCKLLDTRKTTPLLRELQKYSVRMGGGYNHRFGLYDMIMLKENHIRAAGSITNAVRLVKERNTSYKIEVEVTNGIELEEAFNAGVDRVMLDNMTLDEMRSAVDEYKGRIELEASGNVTLETVRDIAMTGVDFISSGALTHSYSSLDISMLFNE